MKNINSSDAKDNYLNNDNVSEKKTWVEMLRVIACISVVMIHVIGGWVANANTELTGFRFIVDDVLILPFTRCAVPIFIMITGCLLLNPKKDIALAKIKKYIFKMIMVLLTFGLFYCVLEYIFTFGINDIWKIIYMSLFNLLQGKTWGVMWYVYLLVGLYIITPVLRKFVSHAKDDELKFVIYGLFVVSLAIPAINSILDINITTFYLSELKYVLIYLMGYVLAYKNLFKEKIIYICGVIGLIAYMVLSYFKIPVGSEENIFVVLASMLLFYLFSKNYIKFKMTKLLNVIARDSFGIYLIHTFWLNVINKFFHLYPNILPVCLGEFSFLLVTLLLSLISTEVMRKIPLLNKIV